MAVTVATGGAAPWGLSPPRQAAAADPEVMKDVFRGGQQGSDMLTGGPPGLETRCP